MGSALLNTPSLDPAAFEEAAHPHAAAPPDALRVQVAERLAAHRIRRGQLHPQSPAPRTAGPTPATTRSTRIAASVAERFAHSPSYRAVLAAEAERATQQAKAAAEIAARNAEAVAQAEQQLLESLYPVAPAPDPQNDQPDEEFAHELSLWPDAELSPATNLGASSGTGSTASNRKPRTSSQAAAPPAPALTVRLFDTTASAHPLAQSAALHAQYARRKPDQADEAEARALDEEISFRHAPVFEEPAGPPVPLPANLIEFPRQLVAPRKVRPRYAEGPLREDAPPEPGGAQLRIFEVDPAHISTTPEVAETPTPQWTSLWLDASSHATAGAAHALESESDDATLPYPNLAPRRHPATVSRRLKAAAIDATVVFAGFLAAAAIFAQIELHAAGVHFHQLPAQAWAVLTGHAGLQPGVVLATGAASLALLHLLYQVLFFSLSEATPGMRCIRIALCTFADENPTRPAMRRRILAVLLSACPLGLGFLWAALDEDRLTWHDLVSRMYQRSY
jgi:uncharacterized RDD family membrane protein YckC